MKKLHERKFYSWTAFVLVIIVDIIALGVIRGAWPLWWLWIIGILCLFLLLWTIGWLNDVIFSPKSWGLSKLLSSAISGARWLSVLYLLGFAIHIGWLCSTVPNLYSTSVIKEAIFPLCICFIILFVLILFFPEGRERKMKDAKKVYISGISEIKIPHDFNYLNLNLRPLVRFLQDEESFANCELVILKSDYNKLPNASLKQNIFNVLDFVLQDDTYEQGAQSQKTKTLLEGKNEINEQLETLIKEVAKREFRDKKDIDQLKIEWTLPCDYNNFISCYSALKDKLEGKDDIHHRFVCCVSPGTAMVGAVLTLLSIDSDRDLYYYSQDKTLSDKDKMKFIDKNSIPLKNILSQALETLEESK